jgi:hypothetical protein
MHSPRVRCAANTAHPADRKIGNRLVGVTLLAQGDLEGARRRIERMLGCYVAKRSHIIRLQFDQRLLASSYRSRVLWLQGFADQAMLASNPTWSPPAPAITLIRRSMPCFSQPAPSRFSSAI